MTEGTMTKKEKKNYIRKIWTDPGHPGSFAVTVTVTLHFKKFSFIL